MTSLKVAVVGAGVVGLSTAVCIQEDLPSCSVTLLAEKFSPDTTSDGAAGILLPSLFPDIPLERQKSWFKNSFDHLLAIAKSQHSPEAGVMMSSGCQIFKEVPVDRKPFWSEYVFGFRFMTERELQRFPDHEFGQAFTTIKCECSSYLPWLEKRFRKAGGRVERRRIDHLEELSGGYDIIVNCSGLGAATLASDGEVHPIRGQVVTVEAPWLKHFLRDGDGRTYIYPGMRGVTLGGTRQVGDGRPRADRRDTKGILERCVRLEPSLRGADVLREWVGLRPGRKNPRVEREVVRLEGRPVHVVHNYGHGGSGVTLAWGTAREALELVGRCLRELAPRAKL